MLALETAEKARLKFSEMHLPENIEYGQVTDEAVVRKAIEIE